MPEQHCLFWQSKQYICLQKIALKTQNLKIAQLYLICCLGTFNKAFEGVGVLGFSGKWAVCRDCTWMEGIGRLLSTWPMLSENHFWKKNIGIHNFNLKLDLKLLFATSDKEAFTYDVKDFWALYWNNVKKTSADNWCLVLFYSHPMKRIQV